LAQLEQMKTPDLFFVFALRKANQWDFLVIPRKVLLDEHQDRHVGTLSKGNVILTLRFGQREVLCSGQNFQRYRNNWRKWPIRTGS
jgi:hypothetical protein